nr:DDE-type integrase/transposase/recombinase [Ruegeria atlantica]
MRFCCLAKLQAVGSKFQNSMIEQHHRFLKRRARRMCGFKSFRSASDALDGINVANMIWKQHFTSATTSGFWVFSEIAV